MNDMVYLIMEERISKRRDGAAAGTHSDRDFEPKIFSMARNLGHPRTDGTANKTKNILNYRDFPMKTDLKCRLPSQFNTKHKLFTENALAQNEIS